MLFSASTSGDEVTALLRTTRDALRQPVPSASAVLALVCPPLDLLALLPVALASQDHSAWRWPAGASRGSEARGVLLGRMLGSIQAAVLELAGAWAADANAVHDDKDLALVRQALDAWFCPSISDTGGRTSDQAAAVLAMSGLQVLLHSTAAAATASSVHAGPRPALSSAPLGFTVPLLARIINRYPLERTYHALNTASGAAPGSPWLAKELIAWEAFARALVSIPIKVANATRGGEAYPIPAELEQARVFGAIVEGVDGLLWESMTGAQQLDRRPLSFIIRLLLLQGYASPSSIPRSTEDALAHPTTLFSVLLPRFLPRCNSANLATEGPYALSWRTILSGRGSGGASFADRVRMCEALLRHLLLGVASVNRPVCKIACTRAGDILHALLPINGEPQLAEKVLLGIEAVSLAGGEAAVEARARIGVRWVGGPERDEKALETFLMRVLDLWTDLQFIKFSLAAKHIYVLTIFLILLRTFPPQSPTLQRVATSPNFLHGLTHYLSHPDRMIRHLGMLGAEVVSELTVPAGGNALNFGIWEGDEPHKRLARRLRALKANPAAIDKGINVKLGWELSAESAASPHDGTAEPTTSPRRDLTTSALNRPPIKRKAKIAAPVELSDSDDSLTGYQSASSVSSTRSASPSPSDLDEYVDDPTLYNAKKTKVPRPVYLAQLGQLLSSRDDADKLEAGLKWGESLVRRKRGFGMELDENAVYIALALAGLNDNFELDDFDNRKQGILNALVACSPRQTAPSLIEQYFVNQYSLQQRSAILTALAMGAREAAGLPTIAALNTASIDWPSKRLPPALHDRYVSLTDARQRQLLTAPARGPVEFVAGELSSMAIERSREDAESKLVEFQRQNLARVKRFSKRPAGGVSPVAAATPAAELGIEAYKDVAAEFFILPLISRFWLHCEEEDAKAARSASRFTSTGAGMLLSALALSKLLATMSVLVHAARHSPLFLAAIAPETLRLAVKSAGRAAAAGPVGCDSMDDGEVSVLAAALELAVVVLDASRDLDGGRTLIIDHAGLVLGIAEWGQLVFERTERGERVLGEGGEDEGRVRRNSAGLCVLLAEIRERWARLASYG